MNGSLRLLLGAVLALGLPASAMAQGGGLGLSPTQGPYDGAVIEVDSGDVEVLYFHIEEDGGLWHLKDWPVMDFDVQPSGPEPPSYGEVLDWDVTPSLEYTGCKWYPLGTIKVEGPPCTYFTISVTMDFGATGGVRTSNTITKHIIPEPGTVLLLGAGVFGLLLRRRRS